MWVRALHAAPPECRMRGIIPAFAGNTRRCPRPFFSAGRAGRRAPASSTCRDLSRRPRSGCEASRLPVLSRHFEGKMPPRSTPLSTGVTVGSAAKGPVSEDRPPGRSESAASSTFSPSTKCRSRRTGHSSQFYPLLAWNFGGGPREVAVPGACRTRKLGERYT